MAKQFRLVNFILNVPYQEPQPERFRRPTSGRQRTAKLEYISKDSGTFVLSGEALNDAGAFGLSVDLGSRSQLTYLPGPFMPLHLFPSFPRTGSGMEVHSQLLFPGGNLSACSPSCEVAGEGMLSLIWAKRPDRPPFLLGCTDTTELKAAVEQSILILQNMILSPFSSDILEEAKSWASILHAFGEETEEKGTLALAG